MNDSTSPDFIPLKLEIAMRFHQYFCFPFFILKKNGEFVEITVIEKKVLNTFEGYKQRGLKEIFLKAEDYEKFSVSLRQVLEVKNELKGAFNDMDSIYSQIRVQLRNIGLNGYDILLAQEVNKTCMDRIQEIPNLTKLLKEFKESCSQEFLTYVTMSFILSKLIDHFPWTSGQIKLKTSLAAMFCDVTLRPEDYEILKTNPAVADLPIHIRNHPIEAAQLLYKYDPTIPHEVIQLIELHHENQDGTGYPAGITHGNIPLLPSIFIVTRDFTDQITASAYKAESLDAIFESIYKKYSKGLFKRASMALFEIFGASGVGQQSKSP